MPSNFSQINPKPIEVAKEKWIFLHLSYKLNI